MVREVAALAADNHHTEALQLIAREFLSSNKRLAAALDGILALRTYWGDLPDGAYAAQRELSKDVMARLKRALTPARFRAIHAAL